MQSTEKMVIRCVCGTNEWIGVADTACREHHFFASDARNTQVIFSVCNPGDYLSNALINRLMVEHETSVGLINDFSF